MRDFAAALPRSAPSSHRWRRYLPKGGAGEVFQHGTHLPLHRMFGPEITRVGAHCASEAEEAGMLPEQLLCSAEAVPVRASA